MATRVALVMDQGTTFTTTIELSDEGGAALDVTGMTAKAQMRRAYGSANAVTFSTALTNGSLVMSMTAAQTANTEPGRYVYDVERLIEGVATVTPEVTRP